MNAKEAISWAGMIFAATAAVAAAGSSQRQPLERPIVIDGGDAFYVMRAWDNHKRKWPKKYGDIRNYRVLFRRTADGAEVEFVARRPDPYSNAPIRKDSASSLYILDRRGRVLRHTVRL